ncbi:MAG: hypothetical protein ACLFQ8_01055 [Candidatus Aenigmatarchaeota archaeon]
MEFRFTVTGKRLALVFATVILALAVGVAASNSQVEADQEHGLDQLEGFPKSDDGCSWYYDCWGGCDDGDFPDGSLEHKCPDNQRLVASGCGYNYSSSGNSVHLIQEETANKTAVTCDIKQNTDSYGTYVYCCPSEDSDAVDASSQGHPVDEIDFGDCSWKEESSGTASHSFSVECSDGHRAVSGGCELRDTQGTLTSSMPMVEWVSDTEHQYTGWKCWSDTEVDWTAHVLCCPE